MSAREAFRRVMAERRALPAGHGNREYLTRAARKLAWMARGVPTCEWDKRMEQLDAR